MRDRPLVATIADRHGDLHDSGFCHGVPSASRLGRLTMRNVVNLLAGLIFGLGLLISGMANPAKVQNFLDLVGSFDPSLLLVMLGAVAVTFIGYRFVLRRPEPVLAAHFYVPSKKDIDVSLVLGAALFGLGWGLSGFCPGPAITSVP